MVTPLHKHPGQRAGYLAMALFAVMVVVLWASHSPTPKSGRGMEQAKPSAAVSAIATPQRSEPPPQKTIEPAVPHDTVTATGTLSYVQSRTSRTTIPVHGLLRKVWPQSIGRKIRAGETIAVIYSPEVYAGSVDVLAELRDFRSQDRLNDARYKLLRWGMRREMLAQIERTRMPQGVLPLIARVSGTVVSEQGRAMQLVDPSSDLEPFTITDPTYAVLYVDVPSADAARVRLGMIGRVTVDGIAKPLPAPVGYISHREEDGMRTLRFDLHHPALQFKAGTAANVELRVVSR